MPLKPLSRGIFFADILQNILLEHDGGHPQARWYPLSAYIRPPPHQGHPKGRDAGFYRG